MRKRGGEGEKEKEGREGAVGMGEEGKERKERSHKALFHYRRLWAVLQGLAPLGGFPLQEPPL